MDVGWFILGIVCGVVGTVMLMVIIGSCMAAGAADAAAESADGVRRS